MHELELLLLRVEGCEDCSMSCCICLLFGKKIARYIALAFDGLEDFKEENVYWAFC